MAVYKFGSHTNLDQSEVGDVSYTRMSDKCLSRSGQSVVCDDEGNLILSEKDPELVPPVEQDEIIMSSSQGIRPFRHDLDADAELAALSAKELELTHRLQDFDKLWSTRRESLDNELQKVLRQKSVVEHLNELRTKSESASKHRGLSFVDGNLFLAVCTLIIIANATTMCVGMKWPDLFPEGLHVFNQICLVWYILELTLRFLYHREELFFGMFTEVWWNWMDLFIVAGGVTEEGLLPIIQQMTGQEISGGQSLQFIQVLRLLRLFRILKLVRYFIVSDLSWTESHGFETFIMSVIVVNAAVMGLELDVPWAGWEYIEQVMLVIYAFELAVRLKRAGIKFFCDANFAWNILDFVIVCGGVMEQWMMPLINLFSTFFFDPYHQVHVSNGGLFSIIRIMRLLRILRLVRLVKRIKPLHHLLLGVVEAFQGMQWVMLLTIILLYASGIVFTSLVGHGYMYSGPAPDEAVAMFKTVPQSMFALFQVMNDDQSIVEPILFEWKGRILFAIFMVISNWAILAILTSVVSDNMISASTRSDRDEQISTEKVKHQESLRRLMVLFREVDTDASGSLDAHEFINMLTDECLCAELCEASGLNVHDVVDLFNCLSVNKAGQRVLHYKDFLGQLRDEGRNADKRSVLHVLTLLRTIERRLTQRLETNLAK